MELMVLNSIWFKMKSNKHVCSVMGGVYHYVLKCVIHQTKIACLQWLTVVQVVADLNMELLVCVRKANFLCELIWVIWSHYQPSLVLQCFNNRVSGCRVLAECLAAQPFTGCVHKLRRTQSQAYRVNEFKDMGVWDCLESCLEVSWLCLTRSQEL